MFQKLNISFSDLDLNKLKGDKSFDLPTFKEYSIIDTNYLFDFLSKKIEFDIVPNVNITEILYPGATPHTDTWQTAINFYFDAGNDETFFWKEINPDKSKQKGLRGFDEINLEKTNSFVASKGDCYLLDVGNSIHSVKMYNQNTTRKILRLYWNDLSFNQVLSSLNLNT